MVLHFEAAEFQEDYRDPDWRWALFTDSSGIQIYRLYGKSCLKRVYDGKPVIYWECVYVRERRDLDVDWRRIWVILAMSAAVAQCPEKSRAIRVCHYKQSLAIESDGRSGIKGTVYIFMPCCYRLPTVIQLLIIWYRLSFGISSILI
ncbi:UNVERIFIED_CONTAM: hypothetical protein FKN15_064737 [Acipenser sinensis]